MVSLSSRLFGEGYIRTLELHPKFTEPMSGLELLDSGQQIIPVHHYLYKRNFLLSNQLTFYPRIYHEDEEFSPRALYFAREVAFFQGVAYHYRQRPNSIMHSTNLKRPRDLAIIVQRLLAFSKDHPSEGLNQVIARLLLSTIVLYREMKCTREPIAFLRKARKNKALVRILSQHPDKRFRHLSWAIRVLPSSLSWHTYLLYNRLTKDRN